VSGTGEQIGATQQQQKKKSESFKRAIGKHAIKPARGNIKLWTKKIILVLFYIYYWLLPPPLLLLSTHHSRIHSPDEARVVGGHAAATNLWNVPFYNKRAWHWQTTRSEESRLINPTPANEKNPTSNNKSTRAPPKPLAFPYWLMDKRVASRRMGPGFIYAQGGWGVFSSSIGPDKESESMKQQDVAIRSGGWATLASIQHAWQTREDHQKWVYYVACWIGHAHVKSISTERGWLFVGNHLRVGSMQDYLVSVRERWLGKWISLMSSKMERKLAR
jgi:hypothetical protein